MSRIPEGKQRELAPEGTHNAVCIQVIDLGTQSSEQWGDRRKVQLAFQLVDEETKGGDAVVAYKQYTFTNSMKGNLMADLKAWLGIKSGDFDMDECLGKPALVTIEHNETDKGTFANITNVSALPKSSNAKVIAKKVTEEIKSLYLDETFDQEVFDSLPDFLQEKIVATPEFEEFGTRSEKKSEPKQQPAKKAAAKKKK